MSGRQGKAFYFQFLFAYYTSQRVYLEVFPAGGSDRRRLQTSGDEECHEPVTRSPREAEGSLGVLAAPFQSASHPPRVGVGPKELKAPPRSPGVGKEVDLAEVCRTGVFPVFTPIHPPRAKQMIFMALSATSRAVATQLSSSFFLSVLKTTFLVESIPRNN